ncbi:MAG: hypothetical protein ABJA57_00720 [Ginsengibacter sp.]
MTKSEKLFHKIGKEMPEVKESKMFGALCLKGQNGKSGVMFWKDDMVFKLQEDDLKKALLLDGAKLFNPMGNRAMGGWVQLSAAHAGIWKNLAKKAMVYTGSLKK